MANIGDFQNIRNPVQQSGQRSNLLAEFAKQIAGVRNTENVSAASEKPVENNSQAVLPNISTENTPKPDKPFRKGMVLDIRV